MSEIGNLSENLSQVSLTKKKKRTQHAFHSDLLSPPLSHNPSSASIPQVPATPPQPQKALSVPDERSQAALEWSNNDAVFYTFKNTCPPPAGTQYKVVRETNCSPQFMRLSMYNAPRSQNLYSSVGLPFGMSVTPFPEDQQEEVPCVDLLALGGPPRCQRCRTYINPGMQHTSDYKIVCNICSFAFPCPPEYASPLDVSGTRIDYHHRPELYSGVADFLVPESYNPEGLAELNPPRFMFVFDISLSSIRAELNRSVVEAIRSTIYSFQEGETLPKGSKVAFLAFDSKCHFFNLHPSLHQATIATMADLSDPFVPLSDECIFADPEESRTAIESCLYYIESLVPSISTPAEPCYAAAMNAAHLAMAPGGGGKVVAVLSNLPSWGPGALTVKGLDQSITVARDKSALSRDSDFLNQLCKKYCDSHIGADLFVAATASLDLANCSSIPLSTGGQVRYYSDFSVEKHEMALVTDIKKSITACFGYQSLLKIRCSSGLQVDKYHGPFSTTSTSKDPSLPILNQDQSVWCTFKYDGELSTRRDCHFQAAILYTSSDGVRKVRVINNIIAVSERAIDIFGFADQDTVLNLWIKECISELPEATLSVLRNKLNLQLVKVLAQYKKLANGSNSSPSQLVFPAGLNTLALYVLSLQKSIGLRARAARNLDLRVHSVNNLFSFNEKLMSLYLYPIMIAVHDIMEDEAMTVDGIFRMPPTVPLSNSELAFGGCYMLFNGEKIMLWIHDQVNPMLLQDLFGPYEHISQLPAEMSMFPTLDTSISMQVNNVVRYLSMHYTGREYVPLQLARFKIDVSESEFLDYMVQDTDRERTWSFDDYLAHLHKSVKNKFENDKSKGEKNEGLKGDSATMSQRFIQF